MISANYKISTIKSVLAIQDKWEVPITKERSGNMQENSYLEYGLFTVTR